MIRNRVFRDKELPLLNSNIHCSHFRLFVGITSKQQYVIDRRCSKNDVLKARNTAKATEKLFCGILVLLIKNIINYR